MWMSDLLPILLVFRGWSMHNWAQRRAVLVANEGQLDILMTTQGLYVLPLATQKPSKTRGPSDAVKRQDTGSVDRVDFSQMTGTRSGYLTKAAAGWMVTWWPPKPRRSCNCYRLPQIDCKWRFHNFERRTLRFPCSAWETHWISRPRHFDLIFSASSAAWHIKGLSWIAKSWLSGCCVP